MNNTPTLSEIKNAAEYIFLWDGQDCRKHDVRTTIRLNVATSHFPQYIQDKIIDRIWRQVKKLKQESK